MVMPNELGQAAISAILQPAAARLASNSAPGGTGGRPARTARAVESSPASEGTATGSSASRAVTAWSIRCASVGPLAWWMVIYGG